MDLDKIKYNGEGIKRTMPSLPGKDVRMTITAAHTNSKRKHNKEPFC